MTCPKCGAIAIHKDHEMHQKTHTAVHAGGHQLHGAMSGHPVGLLVVAGLWAVSKAIHLASHTWTCSNRKCGHEFS